MCTNKFFILKIPKIILLTNVLYFRRLTQLQAGLPHAPEEQLCFLIKRAIFDCPMDIDQNEINNINHYIISVRTTMNILFVL